MFKNIQMICTGNICRSPMAEYLLKADVDIAAKGISVTSAGIGALVGHRADAHVETLLLEDNIDCSMHLGRQLSQEIIKNSDLLLVMENIHKYNILKVSPHSRGKVFLLGHWDNFEIPDPYQKDLNTFRQTMEKIQQGLIGWKTKLFG